MRNRLKAKKQLLGGFVGNAGFSAKADLGLFRASAEIRPGNRPELQTHVKIRAVFLQNHPELQGRGKSRATATKTVQNSRAATDAAQPQVSETNEAGNPRRCRPHSSRLQSRNQAQHSTALTRPNAIQRNQTDRISRKALSQKRGGAKRLADFASAAPHRPHAAEPCAGKRPGALTPQSRCGVGAQRPGRRRSRRPHTSR